MSASSDRLLAVLTDGMSDKLVEELAKGVLKRDTSIALLLRVHREYRKTRKVSKKTIRDIRLYLKELHTSALST